jgi:hypothetical protein
VAVQASPKCECCRNLESFEAVLKSANISLISDTLKAVQLLQRFKKGQSLPAFEEVQSLQGFEAGEILQSSYTPEYTTPYCSIEKIRRNKFDNFGYVV